MVLNVLVVAKKVKNVLVKKKLAIVVVVMNVAAKKAIVNVKDTKKNILVDVDVVVKVNNSPFLFALFCPVRASPALYASLDGREILPITTCRRAPVTLGRVLGIPRMA